MRARPTPTTFSISDPGADTVTAVTVDCGANGGDPATNATFDDDSGSFDCTFPDGDATSTVSASATDDDGATGAADTQDVTINNVAPTVILDAGNDLDVDEGSTHTYDLQHFRSGRRHRHRRHRRLRRQRRRPGHQRHLRRRQWQLRLHLPRRRRHQHRQRQRD